jgi:RNA polymerase sigma-70 factor, ECF subfamily
VALVNAWQRLLVKNAMAVSGAELIGRMAAGDRAACAPFYDRYASLAFTLILRIVRDRADAADVLQEVFWEAWQAAGGYDPARGTPEAWILTRARSRAIDRVRSIRRRSGTFVAPLDEALAKASDDVGDPAEEAADRRRIRSALERLPDAQREAIELAYFGGLTQTEIAERLKQPLGTVKTRIRLGLERLRENLRGR